jgi:hypothetical protein
MTQGQLDFLIAVRRLTKDGVGPSYRELLDELGLASLSQVVDTVNYLVAAGMLAKGDGKRSLVVLVENPAYTPAVLRQLPIRQLENLSYAVEDALGEREKER